MELIKVDPLEYGIEIDDAREMVEKFAPMISKMTDLEGEFNQVVAMDISDEAIEKAKELRKQYVKIRTGTDAIHKHFKDFYLKGGRFVDSLRKAQREIGEPREKELLDIEKYHENKEKERIAILQEERAKDLSAFQVETIPDNLGEMPDDVWNNFRAGAKVNYENKLKEAEREEQERKEQEAENQRIREEIERLARENQEKEEQLQREREAREAREEAEKISEGPSVGSIAVDDHDARILESIALDLATIKQKYQFNDDACKRSVHALIDSVIVAITD